MKPLIRTILIVFAFGSLVTTGELSAQWNKIAPNLALPLPGFPYPAFGAIHYKDGVIWVGTEDLWFSTDLGKNWQKSNIDLTGDLVTDINFYDKLTGIISTVGAGVFLTTDGGKNWNLILTVAQPDVILNASFHRSPKIIHAIAGNGRFFTTTDGGANWNNNRPGVDFGICFTISPDDHIYALTTKDNPIGEIATISVSNDLGATWKVTPGTPDGDSYTICADSSDMKRLYLASEDHESSVDPLNNSQVFYSSDAGTSWNSTIAFHTFYFSGGMATTANTVYASSLKQGIYRSTDQGVSWTNIGGPLSMAFDSRNLTCVNDNTIFALDDDGSVWETTNSGGDPLSGVGTNDLILSRNSLFSTDSLIHCDSSISKFITLLPKGCAPPTITKVELQGGVDSLSYQVIPLVGDSIGVKFFPLFDSVNADTLVLSLSDGSKKIISLAGFGIQRFPLTLVTQDQNSDTLGSSANIPIMLKGLQKTEDITLVIHYDTVLKYNGSFSPSGAQLDIPGEQWKGRSKLKITGAIPNSTLGFARFDIFNDSVPVQHVTFDSVTVLSAISVCQYISSARVTSTITPLAGCGVATISRFLHYGRTPDLGIIPNPTSGSASITSSMDLGEVNVTIYDMLGTEQGRTTMILRKNTPAKLLLPPVGGVYDVRIRSVAGISDLRVVVNK